MSFFVCSQNILLPVMYGQCYTGFHIIYYHAQEDSTVCSVILHGAMNFLIEKNVVQLYVFLLWNHNDSIHKLVAYDCFVHTSNT